MTSARNPVISLAALCGVAAVMLLAARSCQEAMARSAAATSHGAAAVIEPASRVLGDVFGGHVTVTNSGAVAVPREITELTVLRSDTSVVGRIVTTKIFGWFPSTLIVTGHYRGKLGIDLDRVKGRLDPDTRTLELELPRCRVLSVELLDLGHTYRDDWFFNRVTTGQTVDLAKRNAARARHQLANPKLLAAADRRLRKRLSEALGDAGLTLKIKEPAG